MPILLLAFFGLVVVGLGGAVYVGRRQLDRRNNATVDALLAAAEAPNPRTVHPGDLDALPAPIQRYLRHVLPCDPLLVQTARLEQTGTFRADGSGGAWSDFAATQHVTTRPPGFVWDASIQMLPGLPVRVLDAYVEGRGALRARLAGVVPVADPPPGPALDQGELLRYLAEAPLYPTALLPTAGITWTPVDDRSAQATLTHRGTTASLVFHVNERDEVDRVTGTRPFLTDDGTYEDRSWTGTWRHYEHRDGLRVPTEGEVAWVRSAEEVPYWRVSIDSIAFSFADRAPGDAHPTSPSP